MEGLIEFAQYIYDYTAAEMATWGLLGWFGFIASFVAIAQFTYVAIRAGLRWLDREGFHWVMWGVGLQLKLAYTMLEQTMEEIEFSYNLRLDSSLMIAYVGERLARRGVEITVGVLFVIILPEPFGVISGSFFMASAALRLWNLHKFLSLQRKLKERVSGRLKDVEKRLARLAKVFVNTPPPKVQNAVGRIREAIKKIDVFVDTLEDSTFKLPSERQTNTQESVVGEAPTQGV